MSSILVGGLGLGFLLAEGAVLQAVAGSAVPMLAVLLASTVSSIAGFAFSALCGALLFHLMENAVYTVQVMIVCSIAIQSLGVAALWRSIDWRSLPVFLIGGVLGVPAGVYLLLQLPTGIYQPFILGMQPITLLVIYLMRPSSSTVTQLDWKTITFIPAALLGAWFGWCIFKRLSDRQFEVAVNVLLILSGIGLIL